jgi:probable poly-beta-1,6-N-acetyl-D-glucosamine export protein
MTKFLQHVHNLRGLAILFVIGVHVRGGVADWTTNPGTLTYLASIFDAEEGNGTIMFVFIGGFLFQYLNAKSFDFRKYLNTKFKFIILPYLIFSIPIILFRIHSNYYQPGLPDNFMHYSVFFQFLYYLLIGSHMAPFWFISAIILYYITAPLFHFLDKPGFYKYVFPLILLVGMFTYRPDHNANPFLAYIHFLPVYLTGMWVSRYHESIQVLLERNTLLLAGFYFGITILDIRGFLIKDLTFEQVLNEGLLIFNFYFLRAIVLALLCLSLFHRFSNKRLIAFEILGDYSFGIFFLHFILIAISRRLLEEFYITIDFSLGTFLLYYTFITALSTVIVYAIKRVAGSYSRNLIGS